MPAPDGDGEHRPRRRADALDRSASWTGVACDSRPNGRWRELGHADIAPETLVAALSPAAQQLVEIARALAIGCRVLVLDEPTSSLTHADVRTLFDLIAA